MKEGRRPDIVSVYNADSIKHVFIGETLSVFIKWR